MKHEGCKERVLELQFHHLMTIVSSLFFLFTNSVQSRENRGKTQSSAAFCTQWMVKSPHFLCPEDTSMNPYVDVFSVMAVRVLVSDQLSVLLLSDT